MERKQIQWLFGTVVLTFGMALIGSTPLAAEGCQPVIDAMSKIYTTPTHLYTTMQGGHTNEVIYASGVAYDNVRGKWARSPVTLRQVMKMGEENRQNSKYTCRYLRDESVNGETAALYSAHAERSIPEMSSAIKSDGQIWISKTKGLPLRHEEDIDDGAGTKMHHSTRYEYTNVRPPV
jgi:hypothetical protein